MFSHWYLPRTTSRHHGIVVKALLPRQFVLGYVIVEQELRSPVG